MKKNFECTDNIKIKTRPQKQAAETQKILVFQKTVAVKKK